MALNNVPWLIPLKIYSGSTLLTSNLNLITFTGSGVTTTIGSFNNLTVNIASGTGTTTGSFTGSFTGSLLGTASYALNTLSASYALSASYVLSSSYALSSSYVLSSSYALSASYVLSSSYAISSSRAISSSYALTSSYINPLTQSVLVSGSLTVGVNLGTTNSENTLNVFPSPAGGTGEGGQILLAASGGLYTSASMLDNYQNQFRILKGTNSGGSTTGYFTMDLDNGNSQFLGAVTASAYSGLPNNYLYVTRNTNQTIGGGTWADQDIVFNNQVYSVGISYAIGSGLASLTGGKVYRITARLAWSAAAVYLLQYSCYDSANMQIGPTVEIVQSTNSSNNISDGTLDFIYAPVSNIDIKIRTTNNTTALSGEFIRGDLNTQMIIQQIA